MRLRPTDRRWRRPGLLPLAIALTLAASSPAAAKMPYFTVEVSPTAPMAGEPFTITARTFDDAEHLRPLPFEFGGAVDGLLVLRSADSKKTLPLSLEPVSPGVFATTTTVVAPGEWQLVAFPDRTGWGMHGLPVGYPDTIPVTVRAADPWQSRLEWVLTALPPPLQALLRAMGVAIAS